MAQLRHEFIIVTVTDARGDVMATVVNESGDNVCIHGYDSNGKYQQYDSYELYNSGEWLAKHGFKMSQAHKVVDLSVDSESGEIIDSFVVSK